MKIYLNPFKRVLRSVEPKDEAFLHTLGLSYEALWDAVELGPILYKLGTSTVKCMGKFDLFNKWMIHSVDKEHKEVQEAVKTVYYKPNTMCVKCPLFHKCSSIHLSLDELDLLWAEIYTTKAEMFNK